MFLHFIALAYFFTLILFVECKNMQTYDSQNRCSFMTAKGSLSTYFVIAKSLHNREHVVHPIIRTSITQVHNILSDGYVMSTGARFKCVTHNNYP